MDEIWKGARSVLMAVAPMLATAIAGPLGGVAVTTIGKALGLDDGAPQEQVAAAVASANPEQLLALKKADADFRAQMRALDISEEKLGYDDRASARARETATKDHTPAIMGYLVLATTAAAAVASLFGFVHTDSVLAGTIIGYLFAECRSVLGYYFGGTTGSEQAAEMLFRSTPAPGGATPAVPFVRK